MTPIGVTIRVIAGLIAAAWMFNIVAVAVFAVPDKVGHGATAIVMAILVLIGGLLPVWFFWYMFRDQLRPAPRHAVTVLETAPEHRPVAALAEPISERETQVLALIAAGRSNKEIAQELSVTVGTVKTHTNNINRKLGTSTRTQAIARARQLGLI